MVTLKLNPRTSLVFLLAIRLHGDQRRKYTGEPYFFHLWNVAEITDAAFKGYDLPVCIAFLHDVLEDTKTSQTDLECLLIGTRVFTPNEIRYIMDGVVALTDDCTPEKYPNVNRATRKAKELERLSCIFSDYQTIKYADLIDNTRSITTFDPNFAHVYMREKQKLIAVMKQGDPELWLNCNKIIKEYYDKNI